MMAMAYYVSPSGTIVRAPHMFADISYRQAGYAGPMTLDQAMTMAYPPEFQTPLSSRPVIAAIQRGYRRAQQRQP